MKGCAPREHGARQPLNRETETRGGGVQNPTSLKSQRSHSTIASPNASPFLQILSPLSPSVQQQQAAETSSKKRTKGCSAHTAPSMTFGEQGVRVHAHHHRIISTTKTTPLSHTHTRTKQTQKKKKRDRCGSSSSSSSRNNNSPSPPARPPWLKQEMSLEWLGCKMHTPRVTKRDCVNTNPTDTIFLYLKIKSELFGS